MYAWKLYPIVKLCVYIDIDRSHAMQRAIKYQHAMKIPKNAANWSSNYALWKTKGIFGVCKYNFWI